MVEKDPDDMTKRERKEVVLRFMAEHGLALPPRAIYRNLKVNHSITFQPKTVENYLDEFLEDGLVSRVDPKALDDGRISELREDADRRAYYIVTADGIKWLEEQ